MQKQPEHGIFSLIYLMTATGVGYLTYPMINGASEALPVAVHRVQQVARPVVNSIGTSVPESQLIKASDKTFVADTEHVTQAIATTTISESSIQNNHRKLTQEEAFNKAMEMVDQMIAARQLTTERMDDAITLLQQSGQEERKFELQARILNAIESGELQVEQAAPAPVFE